MTSSASSSQLPRVLLGALIGAVLGLLMLGVALAAWWLAVARHEPQPIVAPEGFEARLEAIRRHHPETVLLGDLPCLPAAGVLPLAPAGEIGLSF